MKTMFCRRIYKKGVKILYRLLFYLSYEYTIQRKNIKRCKNPLQEVLWKLTATATLTRFCERETMVL